MTNEENLRHALAERKTFLSERWYEGADEIDKALQERIEQAREILAEAEHNRGWLAWEAEQIAAGTFAEYTTPKFIMGDLTL